MPLVADVVKVGVDPSGGRHAGGKMFALVGVDEPAGAGRGFRAPTESYDETTEALLVAMGFEHHAADPQRSEDRLPLLVWPATATPAAHAEGSASPARLPLVVLISVYAVSIAGLVAIPGVDPEGRPWRFDLFHAFYFISYTGSTIGFGEVPYAFTPAQRLWVTVCIYLTVIGWLYAVGTILNLLQDPAFRRALAESRFAGEVRGLAEPFWIICGYGEAGSLLVRALCRRGVQTVVLDADAERLARLDLEDVGFDVPCLAADARASRILRLAGLVHPRCLGVVAIAADDAIDVKVAITAKLLNPRLRVIARAEHASTAANLASFETDRIIDAYETFGEHLAMALVEPSLHMLYEYLIRQPGQPLPPRLAPPRGQWIVCGHGRFGSRLGCFRRFNRRRSIPR